MILKAMGEKEEKFLGPYFFGLGKNQLIIDSNERPLNLFFADSQTLTNADKQRKQNPDHQAPDTAVKKKIPPADNSKNQGQGTAQPEKDKTTENSR